MSVIAVAAHLAALAAGNAFAQEAAVAPGKAEVVITGKKLGMGLMVTEDAPKARSTITAEELEKQRPTGNAYEALEMLPAVNSYNYDATGLFGGGLTLRGFNSDQIGATINGVPVNDSGSFAVYPQEYVDQENTCTQTVTQGSTDVDSPQVGATGGNFGITTCNPEDKQRFRVMQTIGQLNLTKTYIRYDSGLLSDNRSKFFISASHAEADKWKGKGGAKRDHIDAGFNYDWDRFNYIHATVLMNEAINHNFLSMTKAEIAQNGYYYDYSTVFAHKTPGAGAQNDVAPSPVYYGLAMNPFRNVIASATAKFRINDDTDIKIVPYWWYGYGTGGTQQQLITEANSIIVKDAGTGVKSGSIDLNGDGDTLDKVLMAEGSFTRTSRPGLNLAVTHNVGNHNLLFGAWAERANHEQTSPMVRIANDGSYDVWLQKDNIYRPDGSILQIYRDVKTVSTAYQAFVQDTYTAMDDRLTVNVGIRTPHIKRDFTNYPNEGSLPLSAKPYGFVKTYSDVLPQLGVRFKLTNDDQLYASLAKNMKAPGNFIYLPNNGNVALVNGVPTIVSDVKEETSWNLDLGYRHQDKDFIATFNVYSIYFKDRLATAYDPSTDTKSTTNVGNVRNNGFEVEVGNTPINGWSFYGSLGYSKSEMQDNLNIAKGFAPLATKGNEFPLTPKWKVGLSAEYQQGAFYSRLKAKTTSKQYSTMMNDESVGGYTLLGIDAGYTFPNQGWLKRPKITLNVSNLGNKQYLNPASQSATNALAYPGVTAGRISYYAGAPRFSSITFSGDF
ncbi:TonB-dependent receptor [Duganella sp. P38]|uniref:TonB-dependent receptor n=1 Tax=Duganella sp. P38 TaxID=3423949 RepID=UPI003D7BF507